MLKVRNTIGGLGNLMFKQAYLYAQMRDGIIPDVYLQDEKYFEKYRDEIKKLFGTGIAREPIGFVAIHVRRGDYVDNPFYVDLMQTDYYQRAMQEFPNADFLVCSDDIEWCKKQKIFEGCQFSEGEEIEDMNLIASCKGIIMANSSFSWWSAYLSNAKVIAPILWHPDGVERTKLLDSWIKL